MYTCTYEVNIFQKTNVVFDDEDIKLFLQATMAEAEIAVLEAIFCSDNEFKLLSTPQQSPAVFCICVISNQDNLEDTAMDISDTRSVHKIPEPFQINATFTLPSTYPLSIPDVSVSSTMLTREACKRLRTCLLDYANTLAPEPMILQLVDWLREHGSEDVIATAATTGDVNVSMSNVGDNNDMSVAVLHIDHMRSKAKYIKILLKWADELLLGGRLLFYRRLILVLLEGRTCEIKEFILRLRTQRVDIDSGGRSCKERMMRVVADQPHPSPKQRHIHFEVVDCSNVATLESVFRIANLSMLYRTQIVPEFQLLH